MFADVAAMAGGALYLVQQPAAVAVLTAVLLQVRNHARRHVVWLVAVLASAAFLTSALEPAAWHAAFVAGCLAGLGTLSAAALRPAFPLLAAACAAAGLAIGLGSGIPIATASEALGTVIAACALLLVAHAGWQLASAARWSASVRLLAPRVIAAWLTAIGVLLLALAVLRQ